MLGKSMTLKVLSIDAEKALWREAPFAKATAVISAVWLVNYIICQAGSFPSRFSEDQTETLESLPPVMIRSPFVETSRSVIAR